MSKCFLCFLTAIVVLATSIFQPAFAHSWEIAAQALYLQPDLDVLNFRGRTVPSDGIIRYVNYNPNYAWGYQFIAGYHVSEKHDLTVNGLHFDKTYTKAFGHIIGNEDSEINELGSSIHPNVTLLNLEYGQTYSLGDGNLRVFGGLQYAQFSTNETSHTQIITNSEYSTKQVNRSFQGGGIRFGAYATHELRYHVGIEGNVATALLTGTQHSNTLFSPTPPPSRFLSSSVVVPEIEAKLGLNHSSFLYHTHCTWNVGWMWIHYFKGVLYDNYNLVLDNSLGPASLALSLQGLYFGMKMA